MPGNPERVPASLSAGRWADPELCSDQVLMDYITPGQCSSFMASGGNNKAIDVSDDKSPLEDSCE